MPTFRFEFECRVRKADVHVGIMIWNDRNEHVATLGDIMLRRTGISWAACRGLCCHRQIAAIAAEEAGWTTDQVTEQVRAFEGEVAYHLPTEESLAADHFAAG